jgi:hypothetical protein
VRNTDLLMNLAAGRDLLAGKYNPFSGADPYSHTTTGVTWVNHSWLYDLGLYQLYQAGGVSALSIARAILCVLLLFILIRTGQAGRSLWGPAVIAGIGILAVSPRLLLVQPAVVSFLFLALTLYFLQRGGRYLYHAPPVGEPDQVTWKNYWPILVLFVAWVNIDEWFFLGPLTVILYAIGQALQRVNPETQPRPGEIQALRILSIAGVAVCLINPFHIFAYTLPTQLGLSETAHALGRDGELRGLFVTGFHPANFRLPAVSPARLSFYLLAVMAALSFAINYRGVRWWRVLLAVFFLALSLWHVRAVPFFAVIAAPILSLNLQEAARRREAVGHKRDPLAPVGQFFAFALLMGLLVAGWPGWLQSRPYERHRFALANDLDPALEKMALKLREMREQGVLPADARGFHFSPEVDNALAFYAPEIKGFFDNRYGLFGKVASDYVTVRRGLTSSPRKLPPEGLEDWRKVLDRLEVDHLILYTPESERLRQPLEWLAQEKANWVLLYQTGSAFVFGNAAKRPEYRKHEMDYEVLAYAAPDTQAPAAGMASLPLLPPPWAPFTEPPPSRDPAADETYANLLQFDAQMPEFSQRNARLLQNALAASTVTAGVSPGMLAPPLLIPSLAVSQAFEKRRSKPDPDETEKDRLINDYVSRSVFSAFNLRLDQGPPENLLLAIRAARCGLGKQANDYRLLTDLGSAYYNQMSKTRERGWSTWLVWTDENRSAQFTCGPHLLRQLRHVQAVSALESALLYRPDLQFVHSELADLYGSLGGFRDIELQHRQAQLKYARAVGSLPSEGPTEFAKRIEVLEDVVERLGKHVEQQRVQFEKLEKKITKVDVRALQALRLGLAGRALEILLESNDAAFGDQGTRLQIELGLMTGRIRDVRNWLTDIDERETADGTKLTREQIWRDRLGDFHYLWIETLLAAGTGDYATADKRLAEIASTCARNVLLAGEAAKMHVMLYKEKGKNAPPMAAETALSLIVAKAISDAPLPASESWLELANLRPPQDLNRLFVASTAWTGLSLEERLVGIILGSSRCLAGRVEEAHVSYLRGLLALEQGDRKHAEEMLRLADELPNMFSRQDFLEAVQEASRHLLHKMRQK